MITASCHCGGVRLQVPFLPEAFLECNCSICGRYGAKWAYYTPEELIVDVDESVKTVAYQWGAKRVSAYHCSGCGCLTHYTTVAGDRAALNARMLDDRTQMDAIASQHTNGRDV